jgi:hypothetical protein
MAFHFSPECWTDKIAMHLAVGWQIGVAEEKPG